MSGKEDEISSITGRPRVDNQNRLCIVGGEGLNVRACVRACLLFQTYTMCSYRCADSPFPHEPSRPTVEDEVDVVVEGEVAVEVEIAC